MVVTFRTVYVVSHDSVIAQEDGFGVTATS